MPSLNLQYIVCFHTEDADNNDELKCLVTVDKSKKQQFRHTMFPREMWTLNRNYVFKKEIKIQLWEEDEDGSSKLIGETKVKAGKKHNEQSEEYEKGTALYRIVYTVEDDIPESVYSPAAKPRQHKVEKIRVKGKVKGKTKVRGHKADKPVKENPRLEEVESSKKPSFDLDLDLNLPEITTNINKFIPSIHGFNFSNLFKLKLPIRIPFIPKFNSTYGLCGGMSLMAADFYEHGNQLPGHDKTPDTGTTLFNHIFKRQLDTFGSNYRYLGKFFQWWRMYSTLETQQKTLQEWVKLKKKLDDGKPTVLGLLYVDEQTGKLWDNHQVLAYDYEQVSSTLLYIKIYDPNYPKRDNVFIKAQLDTTLTHKKEVQRLISHHQIPDVRNRLVRGFFVINVSKQKPLRELIQAI